MKTDSVNTQEAGESSRSAKSVDVVDATGLSLLRQLVSGKNALHDLDVFACNQGEHDAGCECFWEQCEAWAKADKNSSGAGQEPLLPTSMDEARRIVHEVDRHFEASERLRLGKWLDPDERERLIAQHIARALTNAFEQGTAAR